MSATTPGVVRPAIPADAAGIGSCHLTCWRETYGELLSTAFFAARDPDRFAANWARLLADPDQSPVVVAVVDGEVAGFAQAAPSRDEPPVRAEELTTLYLRVAQHGSGLGQALLGAVLGSRPASLWVAEENPRARRFYARNGFRPDGARQVVDSWEGLAEIRLVR
ncbi:GNAT family N-acetyltransferase [Modestobacter sp. VKM Ac-2977]|uniref:GNAT family N-acetyltransferase n=1 Tax=Modestobacter sp. VKM Ac-2977 TaxID=3004131 RepID=UPI0022AAD434|nr:GNAT family N-acetyltransferase [Modestobacter sp. VKM Ac-2977]MCZ2819303.1 GNAT family N-acetyltransferase [Modestobacter sp. VKM Ac-2977]